jgi:hypothetical protein
MFGFDGRGRRTHDIRQQVFDAATAKALETLNTESSPHDIRKVTRRLVRRLMNEVNRRRELLLDVSEETGEPGTAVCTLGNGVFPGSSLTTRRRVRHCDAFDTEDELLDHIDRKRKLTRFIADIGVETWQWFLAYWRAGHKSASVRDRVRFHRLRQKLLADL